MTEKICENCRFFEKTVFRGKCHYYPPKSLFSVEGEKRYILPLVHPDNWCGFFEEKIDESDSYADARKYAKIYKKLEYQMENRSLIREALSRIKSIEKQLDIKHAGK